MSRDIDIEQLSAAEGPDDGRDVDLSEEAVDDEFDGLRPWLVGLVEALDVEGDVDTFEQVCRQIDDPGADDQLWGAAARLAVERGEDDPVEGVVAALFWLKSRGFEVGRSPGDRWRIHRVLNAGSRVLDLMLDDPNWRRMAVEALFYRVLGMAIPRAEVGSQGVVAEVSCGVEWDEQAGEPLRRSLPDGPDGDVVDWLLDELMVRGLSSLTLNSVIQESRRGRNWEVDDVFADWMGQLPADEARLVAGALFGPARLGGPDRSERERMLDAFGLARSIDEEFAPDDDRTDAYRTRLQRIEQLRRVPSGLSPTFELTADDSSWRGRWEVSVHPVRRNRQGEMGYFVLEAGLVFDDDQPQVPKWPQADKNRLKQELQARAKARDEETFGAFSNGLDELVEAFNTRPAVLAGRRVGSGSTLTRRSPLWEELDEGIGEMVRQVRSGDVQAVAGLFERWTFRCARSE